jgi:hypothetical protein
LGTDKNGLEQKTVQAVDLFGPPGAIRMHEETTNPVVAN